jgi:hypothetical protein
MSIVSESQKHFFGCVPNSRQPALWETHKLGVLKPVAVHADVAREAHGNPVPESARQDVVVDVHPEHLDVLLQRALGDARADGNADLGDRAVLVRPGALGVVAALRVSAVFRLLTEVANGPTMRLWYTWRPW